MHDLILKTYFAKSKYLSIYISIIESALLKNRKKSKHEYFERHHILPSCIFPKFKDLRENKWNGVLLTPREHFICHYLLCKMSEKGTDDWIKLSRAFTFMWSKNKLHNHRYVNSRLYELARKNIGIIMSDSQSGKGNSQFGTTWVSHIEKKECIKIPATEFEQYEAQGYIHRRVMNFDTYKPEPVIPKRIKQQVETIDRKIKKLKAQKMALLKGFEPLAT